MVLCVVCFIMLMVRRLYLVKTTIKSANYVSNCAELLSRHVLDVFGMVLFSLIYAHHSTYSMHLFIERLI